MKALIPKQANTNKLLNIIKLILLVVTFGFVFYKLIYAYHIKSLYHDFAFDTSNDNLLLLLIVFVMAGFNWLIESFKWRLLIAKNEPMTFGYAVRAVLSGVALSIITPNQIGDFLGRVIHLKKLNKVKGSLVTVIGHTAQVIMTFAFGLFGLIWFLDDQHRMTETFSNYSYAILSVLVVITFIAYLNIDWISKLKLPEKMRPYLDVFGKYNRKELSLVLVLALMRYLLFLSQYNLLLHFYHVETTFYENLFCVCGTLFVQSFVPSFLLLDIGMRGASALWFFGFYTPQTNPVLLAAYSLWAINLLLPGLVGLYFILKWRMDK